MSAIITLKNVTKRFEDTNARLTALSDIDLAIHEREFFIFVGPSGSGKSTLLRIMSGLEKTHGGEVKYQEGIAPKDRSFVFQQFALLPWLTVFENVELGLLAQEVPKEERTKKVLEELTQFGLEKFAKSYPRELSGGMRQRVGIARALITNPKVLFMDEPFSELDSFTAEELRKEISAIWEKRKLTVIMVTHIIEEALELGTRIVVLTPCPGKIEKIIQNNLPRPRNKRSKEFFALEDELYALVKP